MTVFRKVGRAIGSLADVAVNASDAANESILLVTNAARMGNKALGRLDEEMDADHFARMKLITKEAKANAKAAKSTK